MTRFGRPSPISKKLRSKAPSSSSVKCLVKARQLPRHPVRRLCSHHVGLQHVSPHLHELSSASPALSLHYGQASLLLLAPIPRRWGPASLPKTRQGQKRLPHPHRPTDQEPAPRGPQAAADRRAARPPQAHRAQQRQCAGRDRGQGLERGQHGGSKGGGAGAGAEWAGD